MKIIIKTGSTNEFYEGCEYALIDLTPELARHILEQKRVFDALKLVNRDLMEITFHSNDAEYFSTFPEELEDELTEKFWSGDAGHIPAPEGFAPEIERTECDRMEVDQFAVRFTCYPKHCDWMVTTHEIDYATVEAAALVEVSK